MSISEKPEQASSTRTSKAAKIFSICVACMVLIFVIARAGSLSNMTPCWLEKTRGPSMDVGEFPVDMDMPELIGDSMSMEGQEGIVDSVTGSLESDSQKSKAKRESEIYDRSDSSSKHHKKFNLLNVTGVRVALAIFGIIFLNMVAICIHHIYQKLSTSINTYKSVEQNISPF